MGKQIKKARDKKKNRYMRTCERCGNEVFSMRRVFYCNFCGQVNNLPQNVSGGSSQQERKEKCYESI